MSWRAKDFDPDWPFDLRATEFSLRMKTTALVVVDMQAKDLHNPPESKMARRAPEIARYWNDRIEQTVVPNIQRLITGILTDMCVFGTARVAAELGYDSMICEDGCATLTARAHLEALLMHARNFGRVAITEGIMRELDDGLNHE